VTLLREPTARYLSEWKHVQRGSTWQSAQLVCDGRPATLDEVPFCFQGPEHPVDYVYYESMTVVILLPVYDF